MTATSTLLAALIAASTTTNGVITVGDSQPFDQVRLYQNPANSTVLTNQSSDGSIDTSTTALVITGATAPTGLVFDPNLSVLRNVTSDIKLLVDTSVELTLNVNIAGTLTAMTVEAGKTAVLTLGLIAGIPMIVGAFGFFPVASPSNPAETGVLLVPTGATEDTDGEYQRFTYDGASTMIGSPSYVAELDPSDWQPNPTIKFKLPSLTQAGQSVALYLFNGDVADLSGETFTVNNLIITADLNGDAGAYQLAVDHLSGRAGIDTTAIDPVPAAGTEITISIISRSSMLISFGSENIPVTLPTDFLATTLNIVLMSRASDTAVPPLSIQVTGVEVA